MIQNTYGVIIAFTLEKVSTPSATHRIAMSLSVTIPTKFLSSSVNKTASTFFPAITRATCTIDSLSDKITAADGFMARTVPGWTGTAAESVLRGDGELLADDLVAVKRGEADFSVEVGELDGEGLNLRRMAASL